MGQSVTIDVPGQQCQVICVLTRIPIIGSYNTQHLFTSLDPFYRNLIPDDDRRVIRDDIAKHVVIGYNVIIFITQTPSGNSLQATTGCSRNSSFS